MNDCNCGPCKNKRDIAEKVKFRKENKLCWSCGEPANYPQYLSAWFCDEHKKEYLKWGFSGVNIL